MNVLLLTQEGCAACERTRALFDRLGADYPLSITVLDLKEPEAQLMAQRADILFPPGIFLDGEAIGYGRMSERKLRREIVRRFRESGEFCADPPGGLARLRQMIEGRVTRGGTGERRHRDA